MNCVDFEVLISAYADGELNCSQRSAVEAHLKQCENCMAIYRETVQLQMNLASMLSECGGAPDLVSVISKEINPGHRLKYAWTWAAAAAVILGVWSYINMPVTPKSKTVPVVAKADYPAEQFIKVEPKKVSAVVRPAKKISYPGKNKAIPKPSPVSVEKPASRKIQLADSRIAEYPDENAQVIVKYRDSDDNTDYNEEHYPLSPAPVPQAGPGQQVVAENEIISVDGKRVQRVYYTVVEKTDNTSRMGEPDENN